MTREQMIDEAVRYQLHLNYPSTYRWLFTGVSEAAIRSAMYYGFPADVRKRFKQIVLAEQLNAAINGVGG